MRPRTRSRPLARVALVAALAAAALGCSSGSPPPNAPGGAATIHLIGIHPLPFAEPSDLAIDETGTRLWTVTNNPDSVYQIDLQGARIKALAFAGQDLEGVAYDRSDQTLWVAEENLREVIHLDLDGQVLGSYALGLTGQQNSGIEGVCVDDAGGMFVVNEKLPGLFVALNPNKSIARIDTLTFAGDYSGITHGPVPGSFWIVSDQSEKLYLWNEASGVAQSFSLGLPKAEGVAFDPANNLIYIVSDSENKLYVWRYAPAP